MFEDLFHLAFTNLKKRGIRSWLTMLGIFIGIAAVVSLISLGQGLQTAITGQFSSLDPDKLIVQNAETGFGPPGAFTVQKLTKHDQEIIERINGVDLVIPRHVRIGTIEYNDLTHYHYLTSLPEDQKKLDVLYQSLNLNPLAGRLLNTKDRGKVVLGNDFLDAKNDFDKEIRIGSTMSIQGSSFQVAGILEQASTFQLNSVVFMLEDDLKKTLDIEDEIDLIVIQVKDQDRISQVANDISRALRKDRNLDPGEEDFTVQTPEQALSTINTILLMINIIVVGIALISLLVGGIGIANTMYTSVLERRKEIGVMKAVGAQNKDILSLFVIESGLLGLVGGLAGIALGYLLGLGVEFIATNQLGTTLLQAATPSWLIIGCLLFSFLTGAISGFFPAWQAVKIKPVEALRYE